MKLDPLNIIERELMTVWLKESGEKFRATHQGYLDDIRSERDDLRRRLAIVQAEYERMKHNDACLSDPEWSAGSIGYRVAADLWRAIKAAAKGDK